MIKKLLSLKFFVATFAIGLISLGNAQVTKTYYIKSISGYTNTCASGHSFSASGNSDMIWTGEDCGTVTSVSIEMYGGVMCSGVNPLTLNSVAQGNTAFNYQCTCSPNPVAKTMVLDPADYVTDGDNVININWQSSCGLSLNSAWDGGSYAVVTVVSDGTDVTGPVPAIENLPSVVATCSTEVVDVPTAWDGCDQVYYDATTTDPLTFDTPGNHYITWTYEDASGNTSTQQQVVSIQPGTVSVDQVVVVDAATVEGNDGSIDVTISGGTGVYTYDWSNDGVDDFDDTEDLTGLEPGTYTLVVKDDAGCTESISFFVGPTVGVDENMSSTLSIYPNPTNGEFTVSLGENLINSTITVRNTLGQVVSKHSINTNTLKLNLSDNENGVYFVEIENNGMRTIEKVIKK